MKAQNKIRKVMNEFRSGSLKSSSGQKVTNPKQAVAIALSEQRRAKGMNEGGMTDKYFEDRAAKAREKATPSMVPTPAERRRMQDTLRDEAAKKVPPTTTRDTMKGFARGGALRANINKQDTKHGRMDMPFASLKKYAGMRKGGKVRRFEEGGDTGGSRFDEDTLARARAWMKSQTEGGMGEAPESKLSPAPVRRAAASAAPTTKSTPAQEAGAKFAAASRALQTAPEGEGKRRLEAEVGRLRGEYEASARQPSSTSARGIGAKFAAASRALQTAPEGEGKRRLQAEVARLRNEYESAAGTRPSAMSRADFQALKQGQRGAGTHYSPSDLQSLNLRKGGKVKEAQMEMRHAKAMKKAGLPKSMVREEMAEAKKYARGGGIESRGKTKGTVIKMAGGGHVRGGGCEQRGKTKGKMV